MKVETIRYFFKDNKVVNVSTAIPCANAEQILDIKGEHNLSLYAVDSNDLQSIKKFDDIVIDKGRKHEKVALSRYLLGQEKIPVLDSEFKSSAQAPRSIRDLLKRAEQRGDRNVYILGVNKDVLDELRTTSKDFDELIKSTFSDEPSSSNDHIRHTLHPDQLERLFLGNSEQAKKVRFFIETAAKSEDEVLILGETGTGKEVIAKAIHLLRFGNRKEMQVINCSAISADLLENELFGHKKGAFTGADKDKKGIWQLAQDSTLFLDEIGDLSRDHQAKILRALSDKKIRPVGSDKQVSVNARIIAATNVDLVSKVKYREFREDLYYRLNTFPIFVPPLRDRKDDIEILTSTFWNDITDDSAKPLSNEVVDEMRKRDWPGNVRVLHSFMRCLRNLNREKISRGEDITLKDLSFTFAYHGQHHFLPQQNITSEDVRLHPALCLRRLKRVSDILFSIKIAIPSLLENQTKETIHQDSIRNNIRELYMLCQEDATLFHSVPTLNEVCGFVDEMKKLDVDFLSFSNNEANSWLKISEKLTRVMEAVFNEIHRITA